MTNKFSASEIEGEGASTEVPAGAHLEDADPGALQDINFDDGELLSFFRTIATLNSRCFRGPNKPTQARSV